LADRCFVIDNTQSRHRLLVTIDGGQIRRVSRRLPDWVGKAIPDVIGRD
jgi:hypothetical protein